MSILSLDQSLTRTGWAFMPGSRFRHDELITGSFASASVEDFIHRVLMLLDGFAPDVLCWESPLMVIFQYGKKQLIAEASMVTPNADQLLLHHLHGALLGIAIERGITCLHVPPRTWRSQVLGDGKLDRSKAKKAAKAHCERLGVPQKNHDAAEAVCIGLYGLTRPEVRYRQAMQSGS